MRVHHAGSAAHALYRTFVAPALSSDPLPLSLCRPLPRIAQQRRRPHPTNVSTPFSTSPTRLAESRQPERVQPYDELITARRIYLVNNETGRLDPEPHTRYDVLARLDRRTHRLIQLADGSGTDGIPVCKIVNKREAYQESRKKEKARKENRKVSAVASSVKTLELNWAIDQNDLAHRMTKMEAFLEEGRKVEVVLARKKAGRKASVQECEAVLDRIRKLVDGVKGAREVAFEGKVGGFSTMYLQGRPLATPQGMGTTESKD